MRLLLIIISLLAHLSVAVGSELEAVVRAVDSLGSYEVEFDLKVNGTKLEQSGSYVVDGERFALNIGDQTISGNGVERCSVNHTSREVVLERYDASGADPLLMVNPAKAFVDLDALFNISTISRQAGVVSLYLDSKYSTDLLFDSSLLQIDAQSNLPRSVSYYADGDTITIEIISMRSVDAGGVEVKYPSDYEVIDLR